MAAIAVEGVLGANSAVGEQHPGGVEVSGEAGVVEGDGVPLVTRVDVDAGLEEVAEPIDIAGAGGLEEVTCGDLLEGHRGGEVGWVEVDSVQAAVHGPRLARRRHLRGILGLDWKSISGEY